MTDTPKPVDVHVGLRIRSRRKSLGLSQNHLAEALGLTFQQVQKYERGMNRVSASAMWEIARTLQVPVGWFFEGLPEDDRAPASPQDPLQRLAATPAGVELAELFPALEPQARASVMSIVRALHGAAMVRAAQARQLAQAS